jgi:hypothetical protein
MKKIIALSFMLMIVCASNAQLPSSLTKAIPGGFDVKSLTSSIMGILSPKLGLSDKQSPGVTNAVSSFLTKKADILPLQKTDPSSYTSKFGSLFSSLKSKLGTMLVGDQMKKFMGLKPKTNDASNVLSQLFY